MPNRIREKELFYETEVCEAYKKETSSVPNTLFETELRSFIDHYRAKNWPDELIVATLKKIFEEMK